MGIPCPGELWYRSEEHTSELQSLSRISYAVFCLKKKYYDTVKIRKLKEVVRNESKRKCLSRNPVDGVLPAVGGVCRGPVSYTHLAINRTTFGNYAKDIVSGFNNGITNNYATAKSGMVLALSLIHI